MWSVQSYERLLTITNLYYHEVKKNGKKIILWKLMFGIYMRMFAILVQYSQTIEHTIEESNTVRNILFHIITAAYFVMETLASFELYMKSGQFANFFHFMKYSKYIRTETIKQSFNYWFYNIICVETVGITILLVNLSVRAAIYYDNFHPAVPIPALVFFLVLLLFFSMSQKIMPFAFFCCTILLTNALNVQLNIFINSVNETIITKTQKTFNDSAIMEATEQFEHFLVKVNYLYFNFYIQVSIKL